MRNIAYIIALLIFSTIGFVLIGIIAKVIFKLVLFGWSLL